MIQRTGNQFRAGISFNGGTSYTLMPGTTLDLDLPATTLVGLMASSSSATSAATDDFSNLSVGQPVTTTLNPQAPNDPCPATWTCQDVGNPSPRGDTTGSGSSLTLFGTGTGIGGISDSFHYVSQSVSGNEALSARVAPGAGASTTAQDGLMMRQDTSPSSPYYAALVHPGGATTISWRTYDGVIQRTTVPAPRATSPVYLKLVRWRDTQVSPPVTYFGTQTSSNGTTWRAVLGSTVAIDMGTGPYLAGMAATSAVARTTVPVDFTAIALHPATTRPPGCGR